MPTETRESLRTRRQTTVRLGTAPDGLPLHLHVNRGRPPELLLAPVARVIGCDEDPEKWTGRLREMAEDVRRVVDARQFMTVEEGERARTYYLSWRDLRELLGPTVLERIAPRSARWNPRSEAGRSGQSGTGGPTHVNLGTVSRILEQWHGRGGGSDPATHEASELVARQEALSGSKLAVGVDTDNVAIARAPRDDSRAPVIERPFLEESLAWFDSVRFRSKALGPGAILSDPSEAQREADVEPGSEYQEARASASSLSDWRFELKMRDLLRLGVELAKRLGEHHAEGMVHCDIKPPNVLVTARGPEPIDSLRVPIGELAPGLTHGYAAPEQILGAPVGPATDQYALGVMLANVIGAMLYGEEATFLIPVGPERLERFTMLKNPSVYVDPRSSRLPPDATRALRGFIERCLAFEPEARFSSMDELATELARILEAHGFFATLRGDLTFGRALEVRSSMIGWVVHDEHPRG